jgi:hypothetical protein
MDQLNEMERKKLDSLQSKVDEYQHDLNLCAALTGHQCEILAELQTIYNRLNNKTQTKHQPLFSTSCKGVQNRMKQFAHVSRSDETVGKLYRIYLQKYREAKKEENDLPRLSQI